MSSCTEDIPFDLNEEGFDRVVVEGFITNQAKAHEVKLSRTTSFFNEEAAPAISDAVVTISNSVASWTLTESPIGSGLYYTPADVAGTVGLDHTLRIEVDGQVYEATDLMNPVATVDSVDVEFMLDGATEVEDGYWAVRLWTTEPGDRVDFYRWRTLINGVTDGDSISYASFGDDVLYNGTTLEGYIIEGYGYESMQVGDSITLEQHAISEAYFEMLLATNDQTNNHGNLFSPPPANIPTNVSNGALGFFSASGVSSKSTVID